MNQDGYLEEAMKMRNLLQEMNGRDAQHPYVIVGFREHVFTGSVSSLANYMALQVNGWCVLHALLYAFA